MITDRELERLDVYVLDTEGGFYHDNEDWAIVPVDKSRHIWEFCSIGSMEPIFKTTKEMTLDDFAELYYHVTHEELTYDN